MYSSDNPFNLSGSSQPYPSPQAASQQQPQQQPQQPILYAPQQGQPAQYPPGQYPPQGPPQNERPVKNCCTSKCMKGFILFSIFGVAAVLIGAVGVLCPFLLFTDTERSVKVVPSYIFCVYCIAFGALIILVQVRIRFIINIFLFLSSYFHRAFFIIFLATLSMSAYSRTTTFKWVGYIIGGVIGLIGVLHIVVGCLDSAWVREQNAKFLEAANEPPAPPTQPSGASSLDAFYGQPAAPPQQTQPGAYPSLASDSAMMGQNGDPRKQMAATAAQMPETQQLASAAAAATVQNMFAGQSAESAAANAFSDPQVQSLAFNAGVAAAKNPAMQAQAKNAASNALSSAYDQLFE